MTADVEKKKAVEGQTIDLDTIYKEIGEFGKHQICHFALLALPIMLACTMLFNYFFVSATLDYRCKVLECEPASIDGPDGWLPAWLPNAIPHKGDGFEKCKRYATNAQPIMLDNSRRDECPADFFSRNQTNACEEFVFRSDEVGVSNAFGLMCDDEYKLAFVGIVNNLSRFIFMPIAGILSDRFGRLRMLIIGMIASAISGICQSFSNSYNMYLLMEFITAIFGTFLYGSGFVLALEWVSSKYRVLTSIIVSTTVPFSEVLLALCAMHFPNFRTLLLVIFAPGLLIIVYHWLLPESTRWLYVSGRYNKAEFQLRRMAEANNTKISQQSLDALRYQYQQEREKIDKQRKKQLAFAPVFRNKTLFLRFVNLSLCWVVNAFVYFGIGITSAQMHTSGNKYVSFMIISAAEIPGIFLVWVLLDRIGRRHLISGALILNGLSIIASTFVPNEYKVISLLLFIVAKCTITCAFSSLYVFTAELWPTNLRNTLMNLCSMIGRVGGMLASSVIPLMYIAPELPFILFGLAALVASMLVLLNPETNGRKLPDTFEEVKQLSDQ